MSRTRRNPAPWLAMLTASVAALAQTAPPASTDKPPSMAGTVTNSLTGEPILRAHVALQGMVSEPGQASLTYGALTNGEGKFTIAPLPPGTYSLSVDRVGFVAPVANGGARITPYTLGPGGKKDDVKLTLTPTGAIAGRVLDAEGEPVEGATVAVEGSNGYASGTSTDDKGYYRLGGLRPGRYRVKAAPRSFTFPPEIRSDGRPDVHYTATYYPNSPAGKPAQRLEVKSAAELSGIDVRLVSTPVVTVSGKVTGLPPGFGSVLVRVQRSVPNGNTMQSGSGAKPDGSFAVFLEPGSYTLTATTSGQGAQWNSAPLDIEVATVNLEHLELRMIPPFDVAGQLRFDDPQARQLPLPPARPGQPPPAAVVGRVHLRPGITFGQEVIADVAADDSFTLQKVQPGSYRVLASGYSGYVKSVRAGATETEGGILDVRNGPSGAITVTLSSDFCEVSGTVNDNSGPVAGATVILESPLNIRSMQADSSGTYHFMRVEPGKYRLVALEEGAVPPRRSEDLEDYEGVTENLDLRAGDKIARDLRQRPPDK